MKKYLMLSMASAAALTLSACTDAATEEAPAAEATGAAITADEVAAAQQAWGEGIVSIGKTFTDGGDVNAAADAHIRNFYAYDDEGSTVLFKPTLAADDQFRGTFDEAMSYFIGTEGSEDKGFAIAPWTAVRWENEGTITDGDSAMAMGNYYFTNTDGVDTKVEYTFGYTKDADGALKITVHHSSIPFSAS